MGQGDAPAAHRRQGGTARPVAARALGLIETHGMIGAVEAADAMCKAARVQLTRYEITRDALVTVTIRGPLGEVEAAVAAGARAAARKGEVLQNCPDTPRKSPATSRYRAAWQRIKWLAVPSRR